jgi:hypothetical protein
MTPQRMALALVGMGLLVTLVAALVGKVALLVLAALLVVVWLVMVLLVVSR